MVLVENNTRVGFAQPVVPPSCANFRVQTFSHGLLPQSFSIPCACTPISRANSALSMVPICRRTVVLRRCSHSPEIQTTYARSIHEHSRTYTHVHTKHEHCPELVLGGQEQQRAPTLKRPTKCDANSLPLLLWEADQVRLAREKNHPVIQRRNTTTMSPT